MPRGYTVISDYGLPSSKERKAASAEQWAGGVPQSPSQLYELFAKLDRDIAEADSKGCRGYREQSIDLGGGETTTLAAEWAFQQKHEEDRKTALAAVTAQNEKQAAEEAAEREKWKTETSALAKKHGYKKVVYDLGLTQTVEGLVSGELRIAELKGIVIELVEADASFTALQVVGRNQAIYTSGDVGSVVMLKNYGKTVLEGSALNTLDNSYVVVKGVTTYRTLAGTKQAIVVETAW